MLQQHTAAQIGIGNKQTHSYQSVEATEAHVEQTLVKVGQGARGQAGSHEHERSAIDLRLTAKQVATALAIFDKEILKF